MEHFFIIHYIYDISALTSPSLFFSLSVALLSLSSVMHFIDPSKFFARVTYSGEVKGYELPSPKSDILIFLMDLEEKTTVPTLLASFYNMSEKYQNI